jgi:hypothetical protein
MTQERFQQRPLSAFIAVLLTLVTVGSVAQDSTMKSDGRMWANYGTASQQGGLIKAGYVQGVIEGMRAGVALGYLDGSLDESKFIDPDGACGAKQLPSGMVDEKEIIAFDWKRTMAGLAKARNKAIPDDPGPVLDIVHQTDKFYSDSRNTPVCMIQAVQESIKSLNGTASSEKDLEMLRKSGCH